MKIFNKKGFDINPEEKTERRSFIAKAAMALTAGVLFLKTGKLFAGSKQNQKYVTMDGEIIEKHDRSIGYDPFLGEIGICAFGFAPNGWLPCDGQLVSIAAYNALFLLIGTTYGGNGTTNFALPDLRGRVPISFGQGTGLTNYPMATSTGAESVTLTLANLPAHSHALYADTSVGTVSDPTNSYVSQYAEGVKGFGTTYDSALHSSTLSSTGGGQPHSNIQPFIALNYCIAVYGIYPS